MTDNRTHVVYIKYKTVDKSSSFCVEDISGIREQLKNKNRYITFITSDNTEVFVNPFHILEISWYKGC
jgi:hypothetical protein